MEQGRLEPYVFKTTLDFRGLIVWVLLQDHVTKAFVQNKALSHAKFVSNLSLLSSLPCACKIMCFPSELIPG